MTSFIRKHLKLGTDKDIVGDIKYSIRTDDHVGWLKCDGRSLNTTTYSALFSVIGYSFGGSGTSFNLPNPSGRLLGVTGSGSGLTTRSRGDLSGSETHTLTESQLPEHTHTINSSGSHTHNVTDPGHTHTYSTSAANNNDFSAEAEPEEHPTSGSTNILNDVNTSTQTTGISINSNGEHTHTLQTTGSGEAFNIIQPTMFISNTFIYSGKRSVGSRPHVGQKYL
jgi:microcystin-dependent protein